MRSSQVILTTSPALRLRRSKSSVYSHNKLVADDVGPDSKLGETRRGRRVVQDGQWHKMAAALERYGLGMDIGKPSGWTRAVSDEMSMGTS